MGICLQNLLHTVFGLFLLFSFSSSIPFHSNSHSAKGPKADQSIGFSGNDHAESAAWNVEIPRRNRFSFSMGESANCRRKVQCVDIENGITCMGTILPYSKSTFDLIPYESTYESPEERLQEREQRLQELESLRHVPKCWAVAQPLLCSLFLPKCDNGTVDLPPVELCRKVFGPCRLFLNLTIWPEWIKCDDNKLFSRGCADTIRDMKFSSGKCLRPLVPTDNAMALFDGVDGCGVQCNDPFYTPEEHKQIHSFIAWGASICAAFNLFAVVTFLIDWRSAKYPSLIIFYINICFLGSCIGWLVQFTSDNRELIVCRKDDTLRMGEPSGGNLTCVVVFILIYFFMMAAIVWFVIFMYAWHIRFQTLGKMQDRKDKKGTYFPLFAWSVPTVLTVTVLGLAQVEGNSVTGICFVGYSNHFIRIWFVLVPVLIGILAGGYFFSRSMITLIRLKISSKEIISEKANANIRGLIIRIGCLSVFLFLTVIITFYCHIYEFQNSSKWQNSFREYMICLITSPSPKNECQLSSKPMLTKLQLHLLSPFLIGILMSLWVWTNSTVSTWTRFFRRTFNCEIEEPVKLQKHKVIAQAFAKRKTFNNAGRLSISFHNSHDDPVGLNLDFNSVASQDFSSAWAAALPKLVTRRGALVGNSGSNRRNSLDSEISFSVQRVSVQSRRNSLDSQISVQISEVKATRKMAASTGFRTRRRKQNRRDYATKHRGVKNRRGSNTSHDSQDGIPMGPNLKRRSAIVGLELDFSKQLEAFKALEACNDSDDSLTDLNKALEASHTQNEELLEYTKVLKSLDNFKAQNSGLLDLSKHLEAFKALNSNVLDSNKTQTFPKVLDLKTLVPYKNPDEPESQNDVILELSKNLEQTESGKVQISDETGPFFTAEDEEEEAEEKEAEDSDDPDENSRMLLSPEDTKAAKSRTANKTMKSMENRTRRSKFLIEDEISLKQLLHWRDSSANPQDSLADDSQTNAREMATQTSLPLDVLEMEELKQSIDEIINSRNCSSKGTQMSPQLGTSWKSEGKVRKDKFTDRKH